MRNIHWLPLTSAHAAPHLVGQRLEPEPLIRGAKRAGDGRRSGPRRSLHREEVIDRLLEAAVEQVLVAVERNQAARRAPRALSLPGR